MTHSTASGQSAGEAVRAALVARLGAEEDLVGVAVAEAELASGVLPRIEVAEPQGVDWSAKDFRGRELRTAVTVRVAAGQRGRLGALGAAVERVGEALDGNVGGWRVASAVFLRARSVASRSDRAVLVEHRMRVVEL